LKEILFGEPKDTFKLMLIILWSLHNI